MSVEKTEILERAKKREKININSKSPSHPHVAWKPWLLFEKQLGFLMSQPYNEINLPG